MSDDTQHPNDDLFDIEGGDDGSTADSDTSNVNKKTESEQDNDLLGENAPPREKAKRAFIENWVKKIESGEKSLDDLASKQSWLVPDVKKALDAKLQAKTAVDEDKLRKMAHEEAKKLLDEQQSKRSQEEAEKEFEAQYDALKQLPLTIEQKSVINEKFKELIGDGVSKAKALKIAAQLAQVDYEDIVSKRKAVGSFKTGDSVHDEAKIDFEKTNPNSLTRDQRAKWVRENATTRR